MKKIISAAVIAATLMFGGVAAAQPAAVTQADVAVSRIQKASQGAERVTAIVVGLFGDPAYANARSLEDLTAYLTQRREKIAAARLEVQQIAAGLNALPPVSQSDPQYRVSDVVVRDIAAFAIKVDGLLADVQGLTDALVAGDAARTQVFAQSIVVGAVSVVEAQSLMLRARVPMVPANSSAAARIEGLACFYDGLATLQRGLYGITPRATASERMRPSIECMRQSVQAGRTALTQEMSEPVPGFAALMRELQPVYEAALNETAAGADMLEEMRQSLGRNQDPGSALATFSMRIVQWEGRVQALSRQEVEIAARH